MVETSDVVIVGAGLSGLSCARSLTRQGLSVTVLEARERVGGRTFTKTDPRFGYSDGGGEFVGISQFRLRALAKDLGIELCPLNFTGDNIYFDEGNRIRYEGPTHFGWNPFLWLDLNNFFREVEAMTKQIDISSPWSCKNADEWDSVSLGVWIEKACFTQTVRKYVDEVMCQCTFAITASEVSLLWFLWQVKAGHFHFCFAREPGYQEYKLQGGVQQLCIKMAGKLEASVQLNCVVTSIQQTDDIMKTTTLNGRVIQSKYVVVALPMVLHAAIYFDPPLNPRRAQLSASTPLGRSIKVNLFYDRPYWKERGLSGIARANGSELVNCTVPGLQNSFPANAEKTHLLTVFLSCDSVYMLDHLSADERKKEICHSIARVYGIEDLKRPSHYDEFDWNREPFTRGAYLATYPPGVMTRCGSEIRKPHGRVFFAGAETATIWNGYMDGAVEGGQRAAAEVLHAVGKIDYETMALIDPQNMTGNTPRPLNFVERNAPSVGDMYTWFKASLGLSLLGFCFYYSSRFNLSSISANVK